MKRILLMVFRNFLLVPFAWCRLCYHASHTEKYSDEEQYALLKYITLRANRGGNVTIDVHGSENIPKKMDLCFFPNHQGLYDVLAIIEATPCPFFCSSEKKRLQIYRFLKQVFACMKAYMLDREDVRQAMQVIIDVTNEVKKRKKLPDLCRRDTVGKTAISFGSFKGGSFKSATKAKCPIVPVALLNAYKPFDTNTIAPVTVQVQFSQTHVL